MVTLEKPVTTEEVKRAFHYLYWVRGSQAFEDWLDTVTREVSLEAVRQALGDVSFGEWSEDEVTFQVEFLTALGFKVI